MSNFQNKVKFSQWLAEYNSKNKIFYLNTNAISKDNAKSALYHEIQHAVQDIENFARGGNENTALKKASKEQQKEIKALKNQGIDPKLEAYKRLHGEVEARNVEQRMQNVENLDLLDDTPEFDEVFALTQSHPHKTMDKNLKDTIIVQDKRRLKKSDTMASGNLDKGQNLKLDKFKDSQGNVDKKALRPYAETMPELQIKSVDEFKNNFDDRKGKFGFINTPYKSVKVDMFYAYKHFYENSSKQNRDLIKSAFFATFKDPLLSLKIVQKVEIACIFTSLFIPQIR